MTIHARRKNMKFLSIFTSTILLLTASVEAKNIKRYSLKSAIIKYKINGHGQMMGVDTNSSGTKSLYFKEYGNLSLEETEQTIVQLGETPDLRRAHTLKKVNHLTVYNVDFKQKKIIKSRDLVASKYHDLERSLSDDNIALLLESGGTRGGTDKVLGFKCEIWNIMGTSQCLYQDQIPLWIEADIMGMKQKTIATNIEFNVNISDKEFELPFYAIETLTVQSSIETSNKQKNPLN
jgi:hypothetical protein